MTRKKPTARDEPDPRGPLEDWRAAGDLHHHFLGAIDKARALPGKILVKRGLVRDALEPLAAGLDLSLELVRTLPALDAARAALAAHLKRR